MRRCSTCTWPVMRDGRLLVTWTEGGAYPAVSDQAAGCRRRMAGWWAPPSARPNAGRRRLASSATRTTVCTSHGPQYTAGDNADDAASLRRDRGGAVDLPVTDPHLRRRPAMSHLFDLRRIAPAAAAALVSLSLVACGGSDDGAAVRRRHREPRRRRRHARRPGRHATRRAGRRPGASHLGRHRPEQQRRPGAAGRRRRRRRHVRADAARHELRRAGDDPRAVRRRPLGAGEMPTLWKTNAAQTGWEQVPAPPSPAASSQAQISSFSWIVVRHAALSADDQRAAGAAVGGRAGDRDLLGRRHQPRQLGAAQLPVAAQRRGHRRRHRADLHDRPDDRGGRRRRALQRRRQQFGRHDGRARSARR